MVAKFTQADDTMQMNTLYCFSFTAHLHELRALLDRWKGPKFRLWPLNQMNGHGVVRKQENSVVMLAAGVVLTPVLVWACRMLIQCRDKEIRCVLLFAVQPGYVWAHANSCRVRQVVRKTVMMSPARMIRTAHHVA
jgi:hypothetical protein